MSNSESKQQRLSVAFEIKALAAREFEGYGSVFGNVDLGGDIVVPGAFTKSLHKHRADESMPQMFWMHNPAQVPGKWLEMNEDGRGLYCKGVLANTPLGNEIHELLKMEAVRGLSIGYRTEDDAYDKSGNRLLKQIDLWEVSPVSLAMNPLAQVTHTKSQLSSSGEYVPSPRELEAAFRKFGCSKSVSRQLVAKVFEGGAASSVLDDDADDLFGNGKSGGTLDEPRWDADDSELLRKVESLRDSLIAESIHI